MKTHLRLLLLLIVSTALNGCAANRTVLHPIEKSDIHRMNKATPYTPEKDGYFVSDLYMGEVMQAKVDSLKKKV